MGLLKVGTVSVDGTHIEELLAQAEKSDSEGAADEQKLPREIARREVLLEKMRWARAELEKRGREGATLKQPSMLGTVA